MTVSISATIAFGAALVAGVSRGWGRARLTSLDGESRHDSIYLAAMNYGPAVALIASILGLALQAGGAP